MRARALATPPTLHVAPSAMLPATSSATRHLTSRATLPARSSATLHVAAFFAASLFTAGCSQNAGTSGSSASTDAAEIKVAAAADLSRAFTDVGKAFETKTGKKVTFSFGSSGMLAKQVAEGAPFDLFAAASVAYAEDAVKSGRCDGSTKALYARGRIVVWTKKGSTSVASLADLTDPRFVKIAIANPEHAPYGKAAREALQKAGIWDAVRSKLVFGENVQQTLQFAQTGNADAAIVALSLALSTEGDTLAIPETDHAPLDQALVVCGSGAKAAVAKDFAAFVASPEGRTIMTTYGFVLPGEAVR